MRAVAVLIRRKDEGYAAHVLGPVSFVFAEGEGTNPPQADIQALDKSLEAKGWETVRGLVWKSSPDPARCWFAGSDWGLSFDAVGAASQ
jgi:hypothetical protein